MPKAETELVIIEKTHELLVWTLKHIDKFPRNHRYGVGLRLEQRVTGILELLLKAKYSRNRTAELQNVNLAWELYEEEPAFKHVFVSVSEILPRAFPH